jgi:hypothetical protein
MEYLNGKLCLEYSELVPSILTKENYDVAKYRGNITVHGIGGNGRKVLVEFDSMPVKYKARVREIYGDPYIYASRMPILNALEWDHKAQAFYTGYELPNGDKLPASATDLKGKAQINYVHRYTEAATWLNMLGRLTTDKAALKRELNISIMQFWEEATGLIQTKKVSLPANSKRLKEKLKTYSTQGYESLIETHKFGNDFSKKIKDEEAESFLKGLLSARNKHDDTVIASTYNEWAVETGRDTITPGAVGYWRKKWANFLMLEREGVAKLYNQLSKRGQRKRPSAPLLLVNSDDNVLDAFFRTADSDWFRPVLYVVIDAHNDYILGYAVGANVTKELVKEAYRNAQRHVQALTGGAYCWQQIQTDHWGISGKNTTELEQFYASMATFTPAGLKNAQTKYVERSFGTTWHQELKKEFPHSYSGQNVTAKEKLNPDGLLPINFPSIEEAEERIERFITRMRLTKRKGSELTRLEEWVANFKASEKSKKHLLTPELRLQIFGKMHEHTNRITANGVTPTILGQRRVYELSQQQIFDHIGKSAQVIYDESDLSEVLITDGKGLRFVARQYELLPSAIADYEEGDRDRINELLAEKKTILPVIKEWANDWKASLERGGIDAESRIQAGVLTKEISHNDQRLLTEKAAKQPRKAEKVRIEDDEDIYNLM